MTAAALILVALLSLPFVAILLRRPVLRRLALRNALRRPRESALVVLGSLLGAAIITGSMVVGDTMSTSIRQVAHTHLGPIDELVSARGPQQQQLLLRALHTLPRRDVDGVLAFATIDAAATSTGPHVLAAPRSQVLAVDFAAARKFGREPESTGIAGATGTAVVMIRAVRERRRQIGTLRALGFGKQAVGRSFAVETGLVAVEGTVIGAVLALVTLYDIVALSDSFGDLPFSVPYLSLAVLLLGTVAASLLATVWPTVSASRIRPAVALRMTD